MLTLAGNFAACHVKGSRVVMQHVVLLPMLIYERLFLLVMLFSALSVTKAQNPGDFDQSFGDNGLMNVSGLAKGTYTLMIVSDKETYKAQFVK